MGSPAIFCAVRRLRNIVPTQILSAEDVERKSSFVRRGPPEVRHPADETYEIVLEQSARM